MNLCGACGEDFASVAAFDRHRVGKHAYAFLEGLRLEPALEDGRRCLDEAELREAGLEVDRKGRWRIAGDVARVRTHHQKASLRCVGAPGTPAGHLFDPDLGAAA